MLIPFLKIVLVTRRIFM